MNNEVDPWRSHPTGRLPGPVMVAAAAAVSRGDARRSPSSDGRASLAKGPAAARRMLPNRLHKTSVQKIASVATTKIHSALENRLPTVCGTDRQHTLEPNATTSAGKRTSSRHRAGRKRLQPWLHQCFFHAPRLRAHPDDSLTAFKALKAGLEALPGGDTLRRLLFRHLGAVGGRPGCGGCLEDPLATPRVEELVADSSVGSGRGALL